MENYYFNKDVYSDNASVSNNSLNKKKKKSTNGKSGTAVAAPVKLSTDPQSVAARERRHRISERFRTLQSLVPGGAKLDTVSMLDEAIHYVKFLKTQIWLHETLVSRGCNVTADDYSDSFQPQSELHYCPQSQSRVDAAAAFLPGESSWVYDMVGVQIDNEMMPF